MIEEKACPTDPRVIADVGGMLRSVGWATFGGADLMLSDAEHAELAQLTRYAASLPLDPFGGDGRHRCYAEAVLTPARRSLIWKPGTLDERGALVVDYQQETEFQPEYGGVRRQFLRASDRILNGALVRKLIWFDFDLTGMTDDVGPLQCGFHLVHLKALPGAPSRVTPDCLHRDGQPYTAVHLVNRKGVLGGLNYIAAPCYTGRDVADVPADALTTFVLADPLDSYIIDDAAICHHMSEVTCTPGGEAGWRTAMLIDFSPLPNGARA